MLLVVRVRVVRHQGPGHHVVRKALPPRIVQDIVRASGDDGQELPEDLLGLREDIWNRSRAALGGENGVALVHAQGP